MKKKFNNLRAWSLSFSISLQALNRHPIHLIFDNANHTEIGTENVWLFKSITINRYPFPIFMLLN